MNMFFNILDVVSELTLSRIMDNSRPFCVESFSLLDSLLDASNGSDYDYLMKRYFNLITVQTPTKELKQLQENTKPCELQLYFLTWNKEYDYHYARLGTTHDVVNENAFIVLVRQNGIRVLTSIF